MNEKPATSIESESGEGRLGLHFLEQMLRIRRLEERCAELYSAQKIRGFLHLYIGEEAVATGVLEEVADDEAVVATYREHGHALLKGISAECIMAEMYGKQEGCSRGRGGSMHLFSREQRFYGGHAIVGGGLPSAIGLALADKMQGRDRATVCFFGEGAAAEGEFHESMNLAALWNLPILFCCENNLYAMGTALDRSESQPDIHLKAASYNVDARQVDGMDVFETHRQGRRALERIREGEGPQFLEFRTYRFRAHSMFDAELYRDKSEVEQWKKRGPIRRLESRLRESGDLDDQKRETIEGRVQEELDAAVEFAENGTLEPVEDLERFVYSESPEESAAEEQPEASGPEASSGELRETTYREALREAHLEALRGDERVFLMGEDVGRYGGSYAVSKGFLEEFGEERIRDTPLSEAGFVGAGIGAAMGGMRPIVEIMTVNFSLLALDQIVNTAATLLHMSGGEFNVPVVIRMATGAGRQLAAQHSHSLEGWYAHIPGLKIVAPATLEDARGMLASALEDPDPVLLFEHAGLYDMEGELAVDAGAVPLEGAAIRRSGEDVTLITYGGMLRKTLEAAGRLEEEGIDAEVIDLRSLRPLDRRTILDSVERTHHVVIVDEGWKSGSLSAEISATLNESSFYELDAPIARICSAEVPSPYAKHLEQAALPKVDEIVEAAREMVEPHV